MSFFKKSIGVIILVVLIGYFYYYLWPKIQPIAFPCQSPIEYKIGTVDPRFGVSQANFQKDITQASEIWSKAIGKQLFEYNPKGALTINLVYDSRQQLTQKTKVLNTNINQTSQAADAVKQQYTSLQGNYRVAQQEYTNQLAQFNQAQTSYNNEVDYWNSAGGAPKSEYTKLAAEKSSLIEQRNALEQKRLQVNQLADQVNAFIDKYNLLVDHINSDVNSINNNGLTGTEFEEGVYISDSSGVRINIYQFDNQTAFIRVLAHELGHALQLDHNNNPDSIMNPINNSKSLALSPQDLQELKTECRIDK